MADNSNSLLPMDWATWVRKLTWDTATPTTWTARMTNPPLPKFELRNVCFGRLSDIGPARNWSTCCNVPPLVVDGLCLTIEEPTEYGGLLETWHQTMEAFKAIGNQSPRPTGNHTFRHDEFLSNNKFRVFVPPRVVQNIPLENGMDVEVEISVVQKKCDNCTELRLFFIVKSLRAYKTSGQSLMIFEFM